MIVSAEGTSNPPEGNVNAILDCHVGSSEKPWQI
jgi:hypothetical protein